ncbi:protease SohB [Succinimonas sp.]|uniref:protease SohB n=1 Tax=Succinimonas sp. TaxID=1936151 RepID=UPI0038643F23
MNTLLELFVFSAKFIIGFGVLFVFAALLILLIFKLSKSVSHLKLSDFDKDDGKLTLSLVNITEKYKERNEQFSSFVMSAFEDDSELSEKLSKKARQYSPDEDKPSVKERYEKIVKEIEEKVDAELKAEEGADKTAAGAASDKPSSDTAAPDAAPDTSLPSADSEPDKSLSAGIQVSRAQDSVNDAKDAGESSRKKTLMAEKLQDAAAFHKKCLYVVDFNGSVDASEVKTLREAVNLIIATAESSDEVLIRLESPGGTVNGYGLCASELERIKAKKIHLTVAVDQIAASGGYLMGSVADRIIAAPFAYLGSIGVVVEFPNFNKVLKKYDVDYEQLTVGEYKRTISTWGENTEEAREHVKEQMTLIQKAFKQHVKKYRPNIDIDKIANGDHWLAQDALALGLVDEIKTSDEYIMEKLAEMDVVVKVAFLEKKPRTLKDLIGGGILLRMLRRMVSGRLNQLLIKDNSN